MEFIADFNVLWHSPMETLAVENEIEQIKNLIYFYISIYTITK